MVLLRPRPVCYYCHKRCHIKRKGEDDHRRFTCEHCLAVNFRDENGEIADVPAEEAGDPQGILRETDSPAGSLFESSIFCQTCLKNQFYYNQSLSNYLPDLEDPDYEKYEATLSEYRKSLEDRYPQVCARCEPKVRAQLQQATYTAKSDHVRRMLAKSRERRRASRLGWRSLVLTFGGLGYWTSVAGQLTWHAMGVLSDDKTSAGEVQPSLCFYNLALHQSSPEECTAHFGFLASHALKLGILCIWWNPKWQHKLAAHEGRIQSLDTYYQFQAGIIVLRCLAWALLQNSSLFAWLPDLSKIMHGMSLVLFSMLGAWSNLAIITIDRTPLVDWNQEIGPLLSEGQFVPPQAPQQFSTPASSQTTTGQQQRFSIGNLASSSAQQYYAWRPPTPPGEDPDAMDWEPLNSRLTAQPRKSILKHTQPSPFHGTLSALQSRGVQHARSVEKSVQREAMGIPPGFFDSGRNHNSEPQQEPTPSGFAEPTFFPQQDKDALGLEKIFDDVLKLRDDAALPPAPPLLASQQTKTIPSMFSTPLSTKFSAQMILPTRTQSMSNAVSIGSLTLLCASFFLWVGEDFEVYFDQQFKLYICIFTCSISFGHFLSKIASFQRSSKSSLFGRSIGRSSGTAFCGLEVIIFAALSAYRWSHGCTTRGSTGQLDPLLLFGMVWQEFYYLMMRRKGKPVGTGALQQQVIPPATEPTSPSPHPLEASTMQQSGFGRPRGDSFDSVEASTAMSTTSSTPTGWKTPTINARRVPSMAGQSPGFNLGGLNLDDLGGATIGSGTGIAGPRQRSARRAFGQGR